LKSALSRVGTFQTEKRGTLRGYLQTSNAILATGDSAERKKGKKKRNSQKRGCRERTFSPVNEKLRRVTHQELLTGTGKGGRKKKSSKAQNRKVIPPKEITVNGNSPPMHSSRKRKLKRGEGN